LVIARNEPVELFDNAQLFHFSFVVPEDGELLQEVQHNEQQVRVVPFEHVHKLLNDLSVFHLPFDLKVFSEVQEQVEGNEQDLLLLPDHQRQTLLFFPHVLGQLLILRRALCLLKFEGLLLESLDSDHIPLDLVLHDPDRCVPNLILNEEFVELGEVGVGLEDVEEVECELE